MLRFFKQKVGVYYQISNFCLEPLWLRFSEFVSLYYATQITPLEKWFPEFCVFFTKSEVYKHQISKYRLEQLGQRGYVVVPAYKPHKPPPL